MTTCRVLARSSDRKSSGSVHTTPPQFSAPLRLNPPETNNNALTNPVTGHRDRERSAAIQKPEAAAYLLGSTYKARNFGEPILKVCNLGMEKEIIENEVVFLKCLLCAKHYFKYFICINLLIVITKVRG